MVSGSAQVRDKADAAGQSVVESYVLDRKPQYSVLIGINTLYIGFGVAGGIIQGGLPPILRAQGFGTASASWPLLLYLPFGLSFLWAPLIDRFRIPFLTQRIGWIIAMQSAALAVILFVAFATGLPLGLLFIAGLAATMTIATMDLALDALAVKAVAPQWRPTSAALKLAGLSVGAIIGGGLFVALYDRLGWRSTFLLLALLMALVTLPVLRLLPYDRDVTDGEPTDSQPLERASLLRVLHDPLSRSRLILLTLASSVIFPLAGLNRLMLVEIGMPLASIGWIAGTLGPLAMFVTSLIAIPVMGRIGLAGTLLIFAALSLVSLAALLAGYIGQLQGLAIAGTVLIGAGVSGVYVTMAARIIGWAVGNQPATDYAAYYGLGRFFSTALTIGVAQVMSTIGWTIFYLLGAAALIAVVAALYISLRRDALDDA